MKNAYRKKVTASILTAALLMTNLATIGAPAPAKAADYTYPNAAKIVNDFKKFPEQKERITDTNAKFMIYYVDENNNKKRIDENFKYPIKVLNDRTALAIRDLEGVIKIGIEWDNANRLVVVNNKAENSKVKEIVYPIDRRAFAKDGQASALDTSATIHAAYSRTYLPVRSVAETIGYQIDFVKQDGSVWVADERADLKKVVEDHIKALQNNKPQPQPQPQPQQPNNGSGLPTEVQGYDEPDKALAGDSLRTANNNSMFKPIEAPGLGRMLYLNSHAKPIIKEAERVPDPNAHPFQLFDGSMCPRLDIPGKTYSLIEDDFSDFPVMTFGEVRRMFGGTDQQWVDFVLENVPTGVAVKVLGGKNVGFSTSTLSKFDNLPVHKINYTTKLSIRSRNGAEKDYFVPFNAYRGVGFYHQWDVSNGSGNFDVGGLEREAYSGKVHETHKSLTPELAIFSNMSRHMEGSYSAYFKSENSTFSEYSVFNDYRDMFAYFDNPNANFTFFLVDYREARK